MTAPSVAVAMRSKDEMPHVIRALDMLGRQTGVEHVLYSIDSGSTDGTLEALRKADPQRLTEIQPQDYVAGRVLNQLAEQAPEQIVILLNADAVPLDDTWLASLVAPIRGGDADATFSWQGPREDAEFLVTYDYARAYAPEHVGIDDPCFFSAVSCAFRRSLWEAHRFREEGIAEDLEWYLRCRRDGARFRYVPESRVEHSHNYSLNQIRRREFGHGQAYAYIFGHRPGLCRQALRCAREVLRDLLYAIRCGRVDTIPHNVAFRIAFHSSHYRGLCAAAREAETPGDPNKNG